MGTRRLISTKQQILVFLLFLFTGQVLSEAFSFCYGDTSSCWTKEGRRQCLVGRYHSILLQNMFEGTSKLRRLPRGYFCSK